RHRVGRGRLRELRRPPRPGRPSGHLAQRPGPQSGGPPPFCPKGGLIMPQGTPAQIPDDGLPTKQRRNRPLLIVHTGPGKAKSTAACALALRAWNQGWRVGEENAVRTRGATGQGGPVTWHKMGEGWSWIHRDQAGHAEQAAEGWAQ